MKIKSIRHVALILLASWSTMQLAAAATPAPAEIKAVTKRVADWQIATFEDMGQYRALPEKRQQWNHRKKYHDLEWHCAALYAGMYQWSRIADDTKYADWLRMIGERNGWKLHRRPYHADDHAVGQFYLNMHRQLGETAMIQPTREHFDWILANPKTGILEWTAKPTDAHDRWGWCDALFMAPPVWARLAKITGERKYLDFMDQEYHATYDLLWDKQEHLFWRDSSYFERREANSNKVFWARGNGWVFGGLALMVPDLPADWKGRAFYVDLYQQMAVKLKEIQRPDGTWSMGLLGGVDGYPIKETSGTSFFVFGLAWGVNNGLLDRATYEPVIWKGWQALTECVTPDGMLGYVQPVGAAPGDSFPDYTEVYGIGAFLAAGAEVYQLACGEVKPLASAAKTTNQSDGFTTFMKDGGWCWYQDPRAIIHDGKLFIGSVKGNGDGEALVGIYDLKAGKSLGNFVMHEKFDRDDHNSPVFYARPDGSVLAMYARHSREKFHYYRISDPKDCTQWGEGIQIDHTSTLPTRDKVTYMNLYPLSQEGKLYNFYRGFEFNPSFVTSTDHGLTWGEDTHFIKSEVPGYQRPYARYAGNGTDTIHVSFTDAHPRDFGNSIYYVAFRGGKFHRADGSLIKDLKADGPLQPSDAEVVFKGSGVKTDGKPLGNAPNAAWTSAMALDSAGHPHIGYTLHVSNDDHRYRIASWDGSKWHDREVAHGGKCLYPREASYTGLITLDPADPTVVFISSDVDPATGKDLGGMHEIYRAKMGTKDNVTNIHWKAVTQNSGVRNIRPVILRDGNQRVVLWNRGQFKTFTDYDLDTVGLVETDSTRHSAQ